MTTEPIDIAEGRRLLDEADPAPWHLVMRPMTTIVDDDGMGIAQPFSHNAELIVWARNHLPALLGELDEAECEVERLRGDLVIERRRADAAEAALAESEALRREQVDLVKGVAEWEHNTSIARKARADAAEAALARVRDLHQPYERGPVCSRDTCPCAEPRIACTCGKDHSDWPTAYPCPTVRALEGDS